MAMRVLSRSWWRWGWRGWLCAGLCASMALLSAWSLFTRAHQRQLTQQSEALLHILDQDPTAGPMDQAQLERLMAVVPGSLASCLAGMLAAQAAMQDNLCEEAQVRWGWVAQHCAANGLAAWAQAQKALVQAPEHAHPESQEPAWSSVFSAVNSVLWLDQGEIDQGRAALSEAPPTWQLWLWPMANSALWPAWRHQDAAPPPHVPFSADPGAHHAS